MDKNKGKLWEKGIIIALLLIVLQLVMYFTNNLQNKTLGYLIYIIFLAGIVWSCVSFSKEKEGQLTFGNLFAHGFRISAIVALIMIGWTVLMFKVIFPNLADQMLELQRTDLLKRGLPEEQIKMGMDMAHKYFMLFSIGGVIFLYAILGALSALIGAAVSKKQPTQSNPFAQ